MKKFIRKRRLFCLAVVAAVVIVPFLYSYFYLGAFWDPYSKLDKLPVAVVNEDKGAAINGTERNLGEEMCDRFKKDASLKFIFTDEKDAKSGTEGNEYYAMITIPEDFSENIASAATEDKKTATITYSPNEKRNFLASQILNRAVLEIEEETRSTVDGEIVQQLADNIRKVPDQMTNLQDGLNKLGDGSSKLLDGMDTLSNGTQSLSDGTQSLYNGTKTLLTGTQKLAEGTDSLLDGTAALADGTSDYYSKFGAYKSGVASLKDGASSLTSGAKSLESGIAQVKTGTDTLVESTKNIDQISTGAASLSTGMSTFDQSLAQYTTGVNSLISTVNDTSTLLNELVTNNPGLMANADFANFVAQLFSSSNAQNIQALQTAGTQITAASTALVQGSSQLSQNTQNLSSLNNALKALSSGEEKLVSGSSDLTQGAQTLDSGIVSLSTATDQLYSAAGTIAAGADSVNSGAAQLNSGANDLSSGVEKLNSGAKNLNSGAAQLNSGVSDLKDGTTELKNGIATAQDGVSDSINDANNQIAALDGLADYAEAPVSVKQDSMNTIPNYGTAFAPYFMSLSLWVGALILFVGIYLDTEGKFKIMSRESEHKVARSFLFLLVGFMQAIALAIVVKNGLGLNVDNVPLYYAAICLVSLVFIAMVQFFIVHLKSAGKLISIVMLILQLTSCGGTFPMELVPKMFNNLFPYMPMTYSVALFKQVITEPDKDIVIQNCLVLGAILVVFMALTLGLSLIKSKKAAKIQEIVSVQFE